MFTPPSFQLERGFTMLSVTVILAFSTGDQRSIEVPFGSTLADVGSKVGAPSGCSYRASGAPKKPEDAVGNGDLITISKGKVDAG